MKKIALFLLLILTLIITATGSSKTLKYVEIGINQTKFRKEVCKSKIGPSFGMSVDYYPMNAFGAFIGSGLLYQNKRLLVKDRTWPSALDPRWASWIITGDFDISISYLEIPLHLGYSIRLNGQISSHIFTGYSFSIPIKDHTKVRETAIRELAPDEQGTYDFDYVLVDESGVSYSKNFYIGFRLAYNRFALLFNYVKALSLTKDMLGISIHGKIDSFRTSFAYMF
jgi:hypothetical protein